MEDYEAIFSPWFVRSCPRLCPHSEKIEGCEIKNRKPRFFSCVLASLIFLKSLFLSSVSSGSPKESEDPEGIKKGLPLEGGTSFEW
jgi:hypothetical protein